MPNKAISPQRWYHAWRSASRPAPRDDPADWGTAFGLEMSLLEQPPSHAPDKRRPGWMQRLTGRRGAGS